MVCPRCGGSLTSYKLSDAETVSCEDCAYIGVSVDHTSAEGQPESWDEAIDRFYEQHQGGTVEVVESDGTADAESLLDDDQAEASKVKPTYAEAEATEAEAGVETDGAG